jgi:lipopolysaccharide transport system ATP-binding protein
VTIIFDDVSMVRRSLQQGTLLSNRRVIDGITFSVSDGERVGIIGRNGAGKSTLLRLIAGIYRPDSGTISPVDDVAVLLDAGFGLDTQLSGRANAITRAKLDRLERTEVTRYVSWVHEFSELEDYFDEPVKTYSTGMVARLVFSLSTAKSHNIILVDEGIGTADARFQVKAFAQLNNFYMTSSILVMASHDESVLRSNCTRGLVLEKGHLVFDGDIDAAISAYDNGANLS